MQNSGNLKVEARADNEIVMTRVFSAPRQLVFDAWTKPDLLKRWFGAPGWNLVVCDIDLQVGGAYRFVMRGADGTEMGWGGVYREITPPERLIVTERFDEAWYPGEAIVTFVLDEKDGKTTFTETVAYESREARDAVLQSNMEHGVATNFDQLEEFLVSRQS